MNYAILLWLVLLSPLPFGAVPAWSWSAIALLVALLLAAWGGAVLRGRQQVAAVSPHLLWAAIPFALALGWGVIQIQPWGLADLAHPLWASAASALHHHPGVRISLDPFAGIESLVRLAMYGGVFWLALQAARDRTRAQAMLFALAMAAAAYAIYGLAVHVSGSNTILWFEKTAYRDLVTGPFVNRNSFATFAGLGLMCTTGVLWHGLREATRGISSASERRRSSLGYVLGRRGAAVISAWLVLAMALLLSESRAGTLATLCALCAFITLMFARGGRDRRAAGKALVLLAVSAVVLFQLAGSGLDYRLTEVDGSLNKRARYDDTTLQAIQDAPWLGTGLGTFESVFRFYDSLSAGKRLDKAHNDYLETALELGVPATAALLCSLLVLTAQCALGALRRRRGASIAAVGAAASVLVGVHSALDFSLQIPAVALTYVMILGVAAAQVVGERG